MRLRYLATVVFRFIIALVFPAVIPAIISAVIAPGILILANCTSLAAQDENSGTVAAKRAITDRDLFDFVWIADPQVSPDGSRSLFTRVITDEKRTGYETSIWMVQTSGNETPTRLTNGKHDAHARWSPDGKRIAFLRGGDKDDAGKPRPLQIAILSLSGGEARIITDLPKGAASPIWSQDSKRIAFLSSTTPEDIEKEQRKKEEDAKADNAISKQSEAAGSAKAAKPVSENDRESDIHIISYAVYCLKKKK